MLEKAKTQDKERKDKTFEVAGDVAQLCSIARSKQEGPDLN
jgi:hypothetical protein